MRIDILTIFPEMFLSVFESGIIKKARDSGKIEIDVRNIRESATGAHKTVDDSPYGGGPGMVMKADVLGRAVEGITAKGSKREVILLSAQGERFTQSIATELAGLDQIVLVCGRYEGVDERFIELYVDREVSVGDYVVSGGEIPAMMVCDAVARLVGGVVGNALSLETESYANGLLEYPQYTRPVEFRDLKVPDVLLSGNHKEIEKWRHEQSLKRTVERRPDLIRRIKD